MERYDLLIEKQMIDFFEILNEKEKRIYAALEAQKVGRGGKTYIHELLGCDFKTIAHGEMDLQSEKKLSVDRIRERGGGRKLSLIAIPNIDEVFFEVLKNNTAGDPMNPNIKWTNLTREEIRDGMSQRGITVSVRIIKQLLKKHGFKKRKALKMKKIGDCENRNAQFDNIACHKAEYMESNNPIISIDTKKKNF